MTRRLIAIVAVALVLAAPVLAVVHSSGSAVALRESFTALQPRLEHSIFGKPLALESTTDNDVLAGDVQSVVDFPYATLRTALANVRNWCEILILHPNIERCGVAAGADRDASIAIEVGRAQLPVQFSYRVASANDDYMHVQLGAPNGPLGTTNFRIELEATPLDAGRTIVHLVFSHGYGTRARLAMKAYLATFGRDKVGFTVLGRNRDGSPRYVDDFRGALERNVMRHYLAIEAYLDSLSAPAGTQRDARLCTWFGYTKRYSRQLHEDDDYLAQKRAQMAHQPLPS